MNICSNHKNCIHKDCPFCMAYEGRMDDGPADCNGVEVKSVEIESE